MNPSTDPATHPSFTAGELARLLEGDLVGPGDLTVRAIASLEDAGPQSLAFLGAPRLREAARRSRAGVLIVPRGYRPADDEPEDRARIEVADPYRAFARASTLFHHAVDLDPGIHPTAVIHPTSSIAGGARIGAYAVIGARVSIGPNSRIFPHCVLYDDARVGADCILHSHAVLREGVQLGDRCILHNHVTLGADGFGYVRDEEKRWIKIAQNGRVVVGDDVEIGALSAIDRAALGQTRVDRGVKIDNLVQVGHGDQIGEDALLCGHVGLAGSVRIGKRVILAGQVGVADHVTIGDDATVTAQGGVAADLPPGIIASGTPAGDNLAWRKQVAALRQLPELLRRVRRLERRRGDAPD